MRINTNISALTAQRSLATTNAALQISTQRLSSGFRINRAADDAAGLSIANQMRGDVRALQAAQRNASQASSVLQIADGATSTIATILDRMKELATQAASANTTDDARGAIQAEFEQLQAEIDRIVGSTKFQDQVLLNGTFGVQLDASSTLIAADSDPGGATGTLYASDISISGARAGATYTVDTTSVPGKITLTGSVGGVDFASQTLDIQTGTTDGTVQRFNFDKLGVSFSWSGGIAADGSSVTGDELHGTTIVTGTQDEAVFRVGNGTGIDSTIALSLGNLSTAGLNIADARLATITEAQDAITSIENAYSTLNDVIGQIGAAQNRLEFASTNLGSIIQNTMAAESTIRDADMAYEMMQFSKYNILAQAGTAMLAQANSLSQSVLQLLR
ncbi:MAG TPA: flagellin [Longimicrobiaceae bacterium]